MFGWSPAWQVAGFAALIVVLGLLGAGIRRTANRGYRRHVAKWARERGWDFRAGADGIHWVYRLPHGANKGVRFQVHGVRGNRPFTLAHVEHARERGMVRSVYLTVVVLHLRDSYPDTEVEERQGWAKTAGRDYGTIGYPPFDELFTVHTDVPGGPRAVVSPALAAAQVRREIPVWSVRGRELVCLAPGGAPARIRTERVAEAFRFLQAGTLEEQLDRALRVADLLGVR